MDFVNYSDTNLPTVSDIRNRWCFGLPLTKDTGAMMPDSDIQQYINSAIQLAERQIGVFLKPTVIFCNPDERGLVQGVDYELSEPPYDYDVKQYAQWGFLQLRERPVSKVLGCKLVLPNGTVIIDFMTRPEWVKLYPKAGQIQIVPYAGDATIFAILGGNQSGYSFITGQINSNLPQMHYIDYVSGLGKKTLVPVIDADGVPVLNTDRTPQAKYQWLLPEDICNVVAKLAAIDTLGIASEAYSAGIASLSTSIDGLSESMSLTSSAENILYGGHVKQYQSEVDAFFSPKGGAARSSERGFTMTVL